MTHETSKYDWKEGICEIKFKSLGYTYLLFPKRGPAYSLETLVTYKQKQDAKEAAKKHLKEYVVELEGEDE